MKTSNKSNIITGAVLLLLAALFSISLFLQLFNFGAGGPGRDNVFFIMGHILYSVYGFSSLLIPAFLLVTGLSCFATKWTAKRTVRLLTAIVPFYTAVITENICRSILKLQTSSFPMTKFIISLVIGIMLIVIEYLFAGIIADKVNDSYYKITKKERPAPVQDESKAKKVSYKDIKSPESNAEVYENLIDSEKSSPINQSNSETPFDAALSTLNLTSSTVEANDTESSTKASDEEIINQKQEKTSESSEEIKPIIETTVINDEKTVEDDDEPVTPATILTQEEYAALIQPVEEEPEIEAADELEWTNVPKKPDVLPPEYDENYQGFEQPVETPAAKENTEPKTVSTPEVTSTPIPQPVQEEKTLSVEEYAVPDENTSDEISLEEEFGLDTFNTQEFSPEVFDESDPALDFPPAEDDVEFSSEIDDESELFSEDSGDGYSKDLDISDDDFITQANKLESELLNDIQNDEIQNENDEDSAAFASPSEFSVGNDIGFFDYEDDSDESETEDDDFVSFEVEPQEDDEVIHPDFPSAPTEPIIEDEKSPVQEEPVVQKAPAKVYHDSIIDNPSYPHGIVIHNQDEVLEQPEQTEESQEEKPKYPTKIRLGEGDFEEEETEQQLSHLLVSKPNFNQINGKNPQQTQKVQYNAHTSTPVQSVQPQSVQNEPVQSAPTANLDPDFFDVSVNDEPEVVNQKVLQDEQKKILLQRAQERKAQLDAQANQPKHSFSSIASNVFDEMEEDIRRKNGITNPEDESNNEENYIDEGVIAITNANPDKDEEISFVSSESDSNSKKETLNNTKTSAQSLEQPLQGPTESANDLTSDELTAFFNAQEEENTPQTEEIQGNLPTTNRAQKKGPYVIPSDLLTAYKDDKYWLIDEQTKQASINLTQTLKEFNIEAEVIGIKKGPVVTMFELLPAPGVKLSRIVQLQDNIALSLAASSVRIVAPIPGKQAVGIEVPNKNRSIVGFREIIEMPLPEWDKMSVPVVLGKDILGKPQLVDLVKTPHMLIAGATGSGKSVCVNSLILSILYKRSYKDVKMILVDPKVVELKLYNNIPHLLTPVITEPKKAFQALQYCLCEMERRYALLDGIGVRDISTYNQRIKERNIATEKLPYIVVIIDEFADLMATTGRELESVVARLTAMSRAVGIHLVLATQRPSVNVITGLIKANIPTRIAFMVASRTDSNIIIDSVGAEKLLGRGDMLYASAVDPNPIRIQGTYVNDQEVENVVDYVKQFGAPDYIDDEIFVEDEDESENVDLFGNSIDEDPLYDQALEIVVQAGKASASYIQRRLKIGYNRAARLVEEMEERGIVGPANGSKPREVIHIP